MSTYPKPVEAFGRFVLLAMEAERNWHPSMLDDFCAEAERLGIASTGGDLSDGYFKAQLPKPAPIQRDQWELCACCGSEHLTAQACYFLNETEWDALGRLILVSSGDPEDAPAWCVECEAEVETVTVDHAAEGFQLADTRAPNVFYSSLTKLRAGCSDMWPNRAEEGGAE